jgi:hypothetical protein
LEAREHLEQAIRHHKDALKTNRTETTFRRSLNITFKSLIQVLVKLGDVGAVDQVADDWFLLQELAESTSEHVGKSFEVLNNLAWDLATNADLRSRSPQLALHLATKAVEQAPQVGEIWSTVGVVRYRVRDWNAAPAALTKSMQISGGDDCTDWFFLAMAHWQRGDKVQAKQW